MTLAGLGWPALLGLGGAAGAAVVALYLLRLRRRQVVVPFARLWERALGDRRSVAPWKRLRHLASLLLHLALVALLVLALGDPRPDAARGGRTLALVVDASASMQARDAAGGGSRLDEARRRARALAGGLGPLDSAFVVRLDAEPVALGGATSDERELGRRLDSIAATDGAADLEGALRLAADLVRGRPGPTVVLLGDGAWPAEVLDRVALRREAAALDAIDLRGVDLRLERVGGGGDNLGITAFAARRYRQNRSSFEALVEIASQRERPTDVQLEVTQDGETVAVERLTVPAGARVRRLLPGLAGGGSRLAARLLGSDGRPLGDALPLDDRASAGLAPRPRQRVLLVSDGNLFLEGALLLSENVALERVAPDRWDGRRTGHDLVVLDRVLPPDGADPGPAIYVDPRGPASPFRVVGEERAAAVTETAARHPLMRWVGLRDLNVERASVFALGDGDTVLAATLGRPILVARERDGRRSLAVGFDLRRSDLPLRVAFPVLLANALDWTGGTEEEDPGLAAHRPPASESTIRPGPAVVEGQPLPPPDRPARPLRREVWAYLLLAAAALLLLEWWTYHRRVTV